MFVLGHAVIDEDVKTARFSCDTAVCKGACCVLPGARGAPLDDCELDDLRRSVPAALPYLPRQSVALIEALGPVEGVPGDHATRCVGDRECVFVYQEQDIARCALERAYLDGHTGWRKPISCHLFPLRVRRWGEHYLRYEQIPECAGGRKRGQAEDVRLVDFLKDPLTRAYGEPFYERLVRECIRR